MTGYQGVEAKLLVINGVEKRRLCGDVSKLLRRIFLLLAFFSLLLFDAGGNTGERTCQIHDSEVVVTSYPVGSLFRAVELLFDRN